MQDIELARFSQEVSMGVSRPDVSNLLRGHFESCSLERLFRLVRALGSDVEIKVKGPAHNDQSRPHKGQMSLMMA